MKCINCGEEAGNGLDECWRCFCKRTNLGPYRKRSFNEVLKDKGLDEELEGESCD